MTPEQTITLVTCILIILFFVYLIIRNCWVFYARMKVLNEISSSELNFYKLIERYGEISYSKMVWQLFKSKNRMYKEFRDYVWREK